MEKNRKQDLAEFALLLQPHQNHLKNSKLGVFLCHNKVCDLCESKVSPFELMNPVQIKGTSMSGFSISSYDDAETQEVRNCINSQMKNVFIVPCSLPGLDFKKQYMNYLKCKV